MKQSFAIEVKFTIEGCILCPFSFNSHYGVFKFCKLDPKYTKGQDIDHDVSRMSDYPDWCPFIKMS